MRIRWSESKKGIDDNEFVFCFKIFEYDSKNPYENLTEKEISEFVFLFEELWGKYGFNFRNSDEDIMDIFPNWITIAEPEASEKPEITIIPGDVFGTNGRINAADCSVLKQYLSGNIDKSMINIHNADVNGDGKINSKDSLALSKIVRGS